MNEPCAAQVRKVNEAADFLRRRLGNLPQVAVLTGTGLGDLAAAVTDACTISYDRIPHFARSTVASHAGNLVCGMLAGKTVAVFQGRFHLYEGYDPLQVTFPLRVMAALGVEVVILSNASGGLNPEYRAGDVMVIADHINLTGHNPLAGPNVDDWGPRFPDMTAAYDPRLRRAALDAGKKLGLALRCGVYCGLKGPSLETPAEMRFLRTIGADAVGFSTVMETIAAVHAGMRVLGLSTITNICDPDRPRPADVGEIIQVAGRAAGKVAAVMTEVVAGLAAGD